MSKRTQQISAAIQAANIILSSFGMKPARIGQIVLAADPQGPLAQLFLSDPPRGNSRPKAKPSKKQPMDFDRP